MAARRDAVACPSAPVMAATAANPGEPGCLGRVVCAAEAAGAWSTGVMGRLKGVLREGGVGPGASRGPEEALRRAGAS